MHSKKLNSFPVSQRLFLHINKTIYSDLDTIWFKGYSVQGPLQQASNISQTMIVALLNSQKEVVESAQFLIFDGTAEGQIPITKSIGVGNFEIVAYSSNMLNQNLDCIFRTTIEIITNKKNSYNYSFGFNRTFYRPNEKVEMQVLTYDKYYKPCANQELSYNILDGDKKIDRGKVKSNNEGIAYLNFPYESANSENLPLKINFETGSIESPFRENTYVLSVHQAIDVQLLPEGGNLVDGLMQIVAFRSVDDRGRPIEISGEITDAKGKSVTEFSTSHQGMGKFMMIPQKGEKYKFIIKSPLDYAHEIEFPEVMGKGFALSYMGSRGGHAFFKVAKNFKGSEEVTAVWQMDGFVLGTKSIYLENENTFSFAKKDLPNGIAKITLFDKGGAPFAERLIFIEASQKPIVDIKLNHKNYHTRSKGVIKLETLTADSLPVDANLSVLVTHIDKGINPLTPIPDIRDYTLFKSELSGQVYRPAQYFDKETDAKLIEYRADLVMLTHGWRKYNWYYELCHKLEPQYEYYNYDFYRGVVTKGKSVVPHAPVEVLSFGKGITMSESKADENGRFYVNPQFSEKVSPTLIISAARKNEFSRVKLTMEDRELEIRDSVVQLFYDELLPHVHHRNVDLYKKPGEIDTLFKLWDTKYIAEIFVVGSQTGNRITETLKSYSAGSTHLLTEEDFGDEILDMESMIYQLGAGLMVENDQVVNTSGGQLASIPIVLNGVQLRDATFTEIAYLSSDMIEGIAFVKGSVVSAELDSGGQDGALMLWTLKGKNVKVADKEKRNKFTSGRYGRVCKYYSPKYSNNKQKYSPVPDNRITVLWDNTVKTDSLGRATIEFYNGDVKGNYLVNIQGISKKDGLIFKEAVITLR
ncbi:hypothetical protein [Saccharicrinis sp. 156]|uniref:hypothetical protein n=1 Tax=Saccharicrinis sp. 156 TaxID=3417574 RepID=UPI003D32DF1F